MENQASNGNEQSNPKKSNFLAIGGILVAIVGIVTGWFLFYSSKPVKVEVPPTAQQKPTKVSTSGIPTVTDPNSIKNAVDDIYSPTNGDSSKPPNQNSSTVPNQPVQNRNAPGVAPPDIQSPSARTSIVPDKSDSQGSPTTGHPESAQPIQNGTGFKSVSLSGEQSVRFGLKPTPDSGTSQPVLSKRESEPAVPPRKVVSGNLKDGPFSPSNARLPFNTFLPIRLQGMVSTLFPGSTVRMEITRECRGTNWVIPAGTIIVGQVQTSRRDRIQIIPTGYLDQTTQTLVKFSGEVRDREGEIGIKGKLIREQGLLKRAASRAFAVGLQLTQTYLQSRGRGTSVIIPAISGSAGELTPQGLASIQQLSNSDYILVEAGTEGSILVTDLPPETRRSPAESFQSDENNLISDEQSLEILRRGDRSEISGALPRFSPSMRLVATELLKELP